MNSSADHWGVLTRDALARAAKNITASGRGKAKSLVVSVGLEEQCDFNHKGLAAFRLLLKGIPATL